MISITLKWFFYMTLGLSVFQASKVHADYRAQCLGPDGKFRRCYLHINQENFIIRYKTPGSAVQIPGKRIVRVVYERKESRNDEKDDPVFLTALYKDHFSAAFVPYYDSIEEDAVLGIQFKDEQGGRGALLMRLREEAAKGLQLQLEGISRQEGVPLR